jgi:putative transposase
MAGYLVAAFRVPTRRACGVVQCNRATFYYRSQRRDVTALRMRLRELAAARPRFGYRRRHILLRREG